MFIVCIGSMAIIACTWTHIDNGAGVSTMEARGISAMKGWKFELGVSAMKAPGISALDGQKGRHDHRARDADDGCRRDIGIGRKEVAEGEGIGDKGGGRIDDYRANGQHWEGLAHPTHCPGCRGVSTDYHAN
jgi:hypothetical protein